VKKILASNNLFINILNLLPMKIDWLPRGRVQLYEFVIFLIAYVVANAERFSMDKTTRLGDWFLLKFMPEYENYKASYAIWRDPATQTPGASVQLKEDEDRFIPFFRTLCALLKALPLVSNADLENMHLPKRPDHEYHPAPVADAPPAFDVHPMDGHRMRIYFYPEGSETKKGKPAGQHGMEIVWGFTENLSIEPEDLPHSTFDTNSPHTLTFQVKDAGKRIGIAGRWENNRGDKGPWSEIKFVFAP
jgi:hypothetical protein